MSAQSQSAPGTHVLDKAAADNTHQLDIWRQRWHQHHWPQFCWTKGRWLHKSFGQSSQFLCRCLVPAAQTDYMGMPARWNDTGRGLSAAAEELCSGCLYSHIHSQHWQPGTPEAKEVKNMLCLLIWQHLLTNRFRLKWSSEEWFLFCHSIGTKLDNPHNNVDSQILRLEEIIRIIQSDLYNMGYKGEVTHFT